MNIFKKTLLATVLTVSTGGIAAHAQTGQAYEIQSATGVGSHPSFPPSRVIDGVFTNKSRWAGFGFRTPEELKLDLGSNQAIGDCLLYTSPSPRDQRGSRMPSSA